MVGVGLCALAAAASAALGWLSVVRLGRGGEAWIDELKSEVGGATSDEERVAVVDELLADFDRRLETDAHWPKAAVYLAVASGLGALIAAWWLGGWRETSYGLPVVATGVAVAVAAAGAHSRRRQRMREGADRLVSTLLGDLARRDVTIPRRRKPRFRGRDRAGR